MNNTTIIVMIAGLAIGGVGGYVAGQRTVSMASTAQIQQMTDMMRTDGASMNKAGGMMMQAGALMEERGVKYQDQEMVMMGKDIEAIGKKHQMDGQSMTGGDMMGMTADGNMHDMLGMEGHTM